LPTVTKLVCAGRIIAPSQVTANKMIALRTVRKGPHVRPKEVALKDRIFMNLRLSQ
jgi:hypothetical protein